MKGGICVWFTAAAVIAMLTTLAAPASASCNFAPDAKLFFSTGSRGAPPDGLPFRGRVGRVSRAVFVPGLTKSLEVGTDPFCKSPPLAAIANAADELAALLLYRSEAGKVVHAYVYGPGDVCTHAKTAFAASATRVSCSSGADSLVVTSKDRVTLAYPKAGDLAGSSGKMTTGPFAVIVFGVGTKTEREGVKTSDAIAAIASEVAAADSSAGGVCATVAPNAFTFAKKHRGFVCIDEIYRDPGDEACDANHTELLRVDATYRNVGMSRMVTFPAPADFAKQCEPGDSDWPGSGCRTESTELPYLIEPGVMYFPLDYSGLGIDKDNPRALSGSSALRRAANIDAAIHIPGMEFVGSIPLSDDAVSRNPAKPEIRIDPRSNDATLRLEDNVVDEPNSAVMLFSRQLVSVRCADEDTACQCFDLNANSLTAGCTVGDECRRCDEEACDTTCKLMAPTYFQCASGRFAGLPCTRSKEHCGNERSCKPAICVPENTVWTDKWTFPDEPTLCGTGGTCPTGQQCGPSLFHFSPGEKSLPYPVDPNDEFQRGNCRKQPHERSCKAQCDNGEPCIGYKLEADGG